MTVSVDLFCNEFVKIFSGDSTAREKTIRRFLQRLRYRLIHLENKFRHEHFLTLAVYPINVKIKSVEEFD